MVINILLLTTIVAAGVRGAPLEEGSEAPTHSPIIAPDSESVIVGADTHPETHHSDVYLGKVKPLNHTEQSEISPTSTPEDDAAEIHHGDTYMMKGNFTKREHLTAELTTHDVQETTTVVPHTTDKARGKNENNGAHPVAPVHHTNVHKKGGEGIMKSIVAHSPVASYVENSKSEKSEKHQQNSSGSVVAHGPMAKNSEPHDKKHEHEGHKNVESSARSTVHHAPMAKEHHSQKTVAHPSLTKNVPVSSGHSPHLNHHVVEEKLETEEPKHSEVTSVTAESPEIHPPTAVVHIARHPSLSKSESVPTGSAPYDDKEEIHVEKRSETVAPSDVVKEKIIEIHHPLLSKTEGSKTNHEDVKDDGVASTTEITGNSLETRHINSGHQLASSHPATISPSS